MSITKCPIITVICDSQFFNTLRDSCRAQCLC